MAAPKATASIGSIPDSALFPIASPTNFFTIGILVGPPTSTILVMSEGDNFASSNALSIEGLHLSTSDVTRLSSLALVSFTTSAVFSWIYGKFISVSITPESSIFAFSQAALSRSMAFLSLERSTPSFFLNSSLT